MFEDTQFILTLGGTETIKHPGISAAGASQELLAYTAALDAEYLIYGKTKSLDDIPVSPYNVVSPAVLSKEYLEKLNIRPIIVNSGAPITPQIDQIIELGARPARSVDTGLAINIAEVRRLFEAGKKIARDIEGRLVLAECVVGGTTTAMGLLKALGYDAAGLMSSSIPSGNHDLKLQLINEGYSRASSNQNIKKLVEENPLYAISIMGDSMQAVVAGMAYECDQLNKPYILAGGTQMVAIAALLEKLGCSKEITIATTNWVVKDKSADIRALLKLCTKHTKIINPVSSAEIKKDSRFAAYDDGHVKEGVGAGALLSFYYGAEIVNC